MPSHHGVAMLKLMAYAVALCTFVTGANAAWKEEVLYYDSFTGNGPLHKRMPDVTPGPSWTANSGASLVGDAAVLAGTTDQSLALLPFDVRDYPNSIVTITVRVNSSNASVLSGFGFIGDQNSARWWDTPSNMPLYALMERDGDIAIAIKERQAFYWHAEQGATHVLWISLAREGDLKPVGHVIDGTLDPAVLFISWTETLQHIRQIALFNHDGGMSQFDEFRVTVQRPVPEPTTLTVLVGGSAVLLLRRHSRRLV